MTFDNHSAQGQIDCWQPFPTFWRGRDHVGGDRRDLVPALHLYRTWIDVSNTCPVGLVRVRCVSNTFPVCLRRVRHTRRDHVGGHRRDLVPALHHAHRPGARETLPLPFRRQGLALGFDMYVGEGEMPDMPDHVLPANVSDTRTRVRHTSDTC